MLGVPRLDSELISHEGPRVHQQLDRRLIQFFDTYSNAEYDLWRGGTVKGSTEQAQVFKSLYGEQWKLEAEVRSAFREDIP